MEFDVGAAPRTLRYFVQNDFAVSYDSNLPNLGSASDGLHILAEEWTQSGDRLTLHLSGIANHEYFLNVSDPLQVASVDGGKLVGRDSASPQIRVRIPNGAPNTFVNSSLTIHLASKRRSSTNSRP